MGQIARQFGKGSSDISWATRLPSDPVKRVRVEPQTWLAKLHFVSVSLPQQAILSNVASPVGTKRPVREEPLSHVDWVVACGRGEGTLSAMLLYLQVES